jgi:hypothetical protein
MKVTHGGDPVAQIEIEYARSRDASAKEIMEPHIFYGSRPGPFCKRRQNGGWLTGSQWHRDLRPGRDHRDRPVRGRQPFAIQPLMDRSHWVLLPAHFSEQISIHFHDHIITGICDRCQRFRLPQSAPSPACPPLSKASDAAWNKRNHHCC